MVTPVGQVKSRVGSWTVAEGGAGPITMQLRDSPLGCSRAGCRTSTPGCSNWPSRAWGGSGSPADSLVAGWPGCSSWLRQGEHSARNVQPFPRADAQRRMCNTGGVLYALIIDRRIDH